MKHIGIFILILAANLLLPPSALAYNCAYHESEIQRYTDLRRGGGPSRQMDQWHRQRNYHKRQLSKCTQAPRQNPIETATGRNGNRSYTDRRPERNITTSNPALRKLQETCNFWIREHNRNPTRDTLSQRNAACKAADQGYRDITTANPQYVEHVRTLAECVKPGNVVDNEVSDCMQGKIKRYW